MGYDAVIVGSGIGGLTAGAYLSRQGRKVLVCEQHVRPGGYFTSFKRKGYTFDGGTQSVEDVGLFIPMLDQLGLLEEVELKKSRFAVASEDFFCDFEKISDIGVFYEELIRLFPHEKTGLMETRDLATRFCTIVEDLMACAPNPFFQDVRGFLTQNLPAYLRGLSAMKHLGEFNRLLDVPLEDYLSERIDDRDVIDMICTIGFYGMSVSFGLAFIYFMMDYYYPVGGFQAVADALAGLIRKGGGEVRCGTLVDEILVENETAYGVRTDSGEELRAPFVISNADMRRTFLEMVPGESVPAVYRERLLESRPAHSMFTVYLGLDIPPEEVQNRGCNHIVVFAERKGADFTRISIDPDFYSDCPVMVSMPSLHDPSLAPEGKSVMSIQYYATTEFCDNWKREDGQPTPDYYELKEEVADQMIAVTEKVIPGISDHIDVKLTASPYTYQRYSLNTGGSTIGWSKHPGEAFDPFLKSFMDFRTPVKNLYQVGHWAFGPGGIPGGTMNGRIVSSLVNLRLSLGI